VFVQYVRDWGPANYEGWDIVPAVIAVAQQREPRWTFKVRDLMHYGAEVTEPRYDFVIASGLFAERDLAWMAEAVMRMWNLCYEGIGFNFLTPWGTAPQPGEFQADPAQVVRMVHDLCHPHRLRLLVDYLGPYDATVLAYR